MEYNKNSKTIAIPEGTEYIDDYQFANYYEVEEIIMPDSIKSIGNAAFKNCKKLKKIVLSSNLKLVGKNVFEGCTSLETITIPYSLKYIGYAMFANCKKLKSIFLHDDTNYIDHFAFYNCNSLNAFELPKNITSLGIKALSKCNCIKHIHIPESLTNIELAAFAEMKSLEKITVDSNNKKYMSRDNVTLIDYEQGVFLQYATNCNLRKYTISDYSILFGNIKSQQHIYNISNYAFAGASNLETLEIPSSVESIGNYTFRNTFIKNLYIYYTQYGETIILNIIGNKNKYIPFENIFIDEGITTLSSNISDLFKNSKNVNLPSTLTQIGTKVFSKAQQLKELFIPIGINMIHPNTFPNDIILHFENWLDFYGKEFNTLQTKTSDDTYWSYLSKDNTKIFSLADGTFYVKIDDFDMIKISKDEIKSYSTNTELLENEPDVFVRHFLKLIYLYANYQKEFLNSIKDKDFQRKILHLSVRLDILCELSTIKIKKFIEELLRDNCCYNDLLLDGLVIRKINKDELLLIIKNMSPSLDKFFRRTDYLKNIGRESFLDKKYYDVEYIVNYCNLLEKYKRSDSFLLNELFAIKLSFADQELLIKNFNKNIKRLLIATKALFPNSINDIFKILKVFGAFDEDKIFSQKVTTFLTEKIFSDFLDKKIENKYKINGDDIHRVFNELNVQEKINYKFIRFFIENYKELVTLEKTNSGIICRIYNNFDEIMKTCTSNKGNQRQLIVTVDKCLYYFLVYKFNNITEENKSLAEFIGKYYNNSETLTIAFEIINESLKSRRNIFTDSMDSSEDIKGTTSSNYSYEWLPKQDWNNLILGKFCNCCAHLEGAGAGIMKASMLHDSVQNFVIRNENGEIIAKSTIYINRKEQYAVLNTLESNMTYRNTTALNCIYECLMLGLQSFIEKYNINNDKPLLKVTIGDKQNVISELLNEKNHTLTDVLKAIDYSEYRYTINDQVFGNHGNDSDSAQRLLYERTLN